jgi:hypothetical protein
MHSRQETSALACTSARALVNGRVALRIALPADKLIGRPLRLHERFPRLEVLALLADPDGGALTESAFADFAVAELARLASLTELYLRDCMLLGHGGDHGPAAVLPPAAAPGPGRHMWVLQPNTADGQSPVAAAHLAAVS